MALLINWEVAPGALTNNRTTTLVAVVDDGTPLAAQMGRHARAVRPPGLAGVLHIAYKWLMMLLGSVARVDGSSLLGALNPFRGTFELPWMVAALSKLESLQVFNRTHANFEALVLFARQTVAALPVYPAEFILTVGDYNQDFGWVPGHFGAAAAQPWHAGLTFAHMAQTQIDSLAPLFVFLFEASPHYVRAQVTAGDDPFQEMGADYLLQMTAFSRGSITAKPLTVAMALDSFSHFASTIALPDALFVLPPDQASQTRLLTQRCALASPVGSAGGVAAAQESLLREHLLALLWKLQKSSSLLGGVTSSQEAFGYMERLYVILPAERRSTDAKPLQRLQVVEDSLDSNKVTQEVAASPSLTVRVQNMEKFQREAREGHTAAIAGGSGAAGAAQGDQDFLSASLGGSAPPQASLTTALGQCGIVLSSVKQALLAQDISLAWGIVAKGGALLPLKVMFNIGKSETADARLKSLWAQRGGLPEYVSGELVGRSRTP